MNYLWCGFIWDDISESGEKLLVESRIDFSEFGESLHFIPIPVMQRQRGIRLFR